jgi:hypothetical protein
LRILTVIAASLLVPYYALQAPPLSAAIEWSFVFILINFYWIVRLLIERRPVHLTGDEARLRDLSFPSLTPREAQDLYAMGSWDDRAPGASLVRRDRDRDGFSTILAGSAEVIYRGTKISQLGEAQFVGTIDLHADAIGDIDVLIKEPSRVMWWPRHRMRTFLARRPDVALALERSVGFELQQILGTTLSKLTTISNPGL